MVKGRTIVFLPNLSSNSGWRDNAAQLVNSYVKRLLSEPANFRFGSIAETPRTNPLTSPDNNAAPPHHAAQVAVLLCSDALLATFVSWNPLLPD